MKRASVLILFLLAAPQLRADQAVVSITAGGKTYAGYLDSVTVASPTASVSVASSPTPIVTPSATPIAATPTPAPASLAASGIIPQNMTEVSPGVWRTNSNFLAEGKCYAQMRLPRALKPGEHVRYTATRKTNVVLDGKLNIKDFRAWIDASGTVIYPNFWTGRGVGTGLNQIKCEEGTGLDTYYHSYAPAPWNDAFYANPTALDQPVLEVREFWPCTGIGTKDGRARLTIGGQLVFDRGQFIENSAAAAGFPQYYGVQCVIANYHAGDLPSNAYVEFSAMTLEIVPN